MSELLQATPDQLVTIGAMVSREWGEYGYRVEELHSYSSQVTAARVRSSDGGRFIVMTDRYGNTRHVDCPTYESEQWHHVGVLSVAQALDHAARIA